MSKRRQHIATAMITMTLALFAGRAFAQTQPADDAAKLLSDTRWSEQAFGVSLLPPLGCKLIETTGDDYLLRMVNGEVPYQITVAVKRSRSAQKLHDISESSKVQMLRANDAVNLLSETTLKVANYPAARLYYQFKTKTGQMALIGQTIIEVNPFTFCVVQVEGPAPKEKQLKTIYEAVTQTVEIADQEELAKRREQAIDRADRWRSTTSEKDIVAVLNTDQYSRIMENGKDVGWLHMTSARGEFNNIKGYRVAVQMMIQLPNGRLDSTAEYFTPFDTPIGEAWTVTTTFRPSDPKQPERTSREIGTGTTKNIEIRIIATAGLPAKNLEFQRPPVGYLPQAEQWLLPQLLPHQAAAEFGFYAYNPATEQLAYRSDRVTPTLAGFQLATRLSPNAPELKSVYNAKGAIVEKDLGGGRKLIASSLRELQPIWKFR